jgi:hypothetical protein
VTFFYEAVVKEDRNAIIAAYALISCYGFCFGLFIGWIIWG